MAPPINAQMLLQRLKSDPTSPLYDPLVPVPELPFAPGALAPGPSANTESSGMLSPAGVAPGGPGTGVGAGASTPRNPAIISDPADIQQMQQAVMKQLTSPAQIGAPPEPPNFPAAPTMAPMPSGKLARVVAILSGFGGGPNPYEVQRRQQFQDALQEWQSQVSPLQATYQDRLRAYEAQARAQVEASQANRWGSTGLNQLFPSFGIPRTGTQPGGTARANQIGKVDLQQGLPVSIMTSEGRLPITDKYLPQMDQTTRDIALNSLDAHSRWFGEQLKLLQARGAAFRLNMMYPVWDKQVNQLVNKTGYEILREEYRYIPAPSALAMARTFGFAPTQDVIRRGQNAVQTLQQLPTLLEKYDKVEQMGMTGPAHGRMFADFMAGKVGTTGMGPEADEAMGRLRASNEFFRTRLTQAHLGGQSSEAERAAIRDILGKLSGTPEIYRGGLDSAQSVLNDYASAVPGFGGGMGGVYDPFQSQLPMNARQAPPDIKQRVPKPGKVVSWQDFLKEQ